MAARRSHQYWPGASRWLRRIAIVVFRTETKTVDETVIEAEWPDLKRRLREAAGA